MTSPKPLILPPKRLDLGLKHPVGSNVLIEIVTHPVNAAVGVIVSSAPLSNLLLHGLVLSADISRFGLKSVLELTAEVPDLGREVAVLELEKGILLAGLA